MVYGPTLGAPIECHRGAGERVVGEWVEVVCSGASGFSRPASDASSGPAAAAAGADPPAAAARSARSLSFATSFSAATPTPAITFSSTPQPAIVYRLMHGGDSDQRVPWRHERGRVAHTAHCTTRHAGSRTARATSFCGLRGTTSVHRFLRYETTGYLRFSKGVGNELGSRVQPGFSELLGASIGCGVSDVSRCAPSALPAARINAPTTSAVWGTALLVTMGKTRHVFWVSYRDT